MQLKITKIIITVIFSLAICCCGNKQVEQHEYYQFGKQITPSGKYVIYNYGRHGAMAFSSDIVGTELFEANEEFKEGKGVKLDGAISEWLSDDTLLVYDFNLKSESEQPKDTLPIKTDLKRVGDFTIKMVYYIPNSWTMVARNFDSVTTTNDSIFVKTIFENGKIEILRFPLGATTIISKCDSIIQIAVHARLRKSMDVSRKNPDGTFTEGLPAVGTIWYNLKPKHRISIDGLNERKIFWDIAKK